MTKNPSKKRCKEQISKKTSRSSSGLLHNSSDNTVNISGLSEAALQICLYSTVLILLPALSVVGCTLYSHYFFKMVSFTGDLVGIYEKKMPTDDSSSLGLQNIKANMQNGNDAKLLDQELKENFKSPLEKKYVFSKESQARNVIEERKRQLRPCPANTSFSLGERGIETLDKEQKREINPPSKLTFKFFGEDEVTTFAKTKMKKFCLEKEKMEPPAHGDSIIKAIDSENKKNSKSLIEQTSTVSSKNLVKEKSKKAARAKVKVVKVNLKYENAELLQNYASSFSKLLEQRRMAMKKYSYPYLVDGVDKRNNLTLEEFYDVYDGKWPVIVTDVVPTWPAFNWSKEFFLKNYGDNRVAISGNIGGSQGGYAMPLEYFIPLLDQKSSKNNWAYMEDEVFLLQNPELKAQVLDTIYTKEDFFKLFPKEVRPWGCMFLWGTKYSHSSLHIDPYNWTGTNAVFKGLKKWKQPMFRAEEFSSGREYLFSSEPGDTKQCQDEHLSIVPDGLCGFPLECNKYNSHIDAFNPTEAQKKMLSKTTYLEVDQKPGEILFIPTGWFHEAFNAEATLAVSGQVMNRNNYKIVLEEVFKGRKLAKSVLPRDINKLSPKKLVQLVMSSLSSKVLEEGAQWTSSIIDSINEEDDPPLFL